VQVSTVEGQSELKVPPGTQPGDMLVLAKKGVPKLGKTQNARRPLLQSQRHHPQTAQVSCPLAPAPCSLDPHGPR